MVVSILWKNIEASNSHIHIEEVPEGLCILTGNDVINLANFVSCSDRYFSITLQPISNFEKGDSSAPFSVFEALKHVFFDDPENGAQVDLPSYTH